MCLSYQASVRSNFPGGKNGRHIGATIISENGEVISVASIRAPSSSSNTTLNDQNKIEPGYEKYKKKLKIWSDLILNMAGEKITRENYTKTYLSIDEKNHLLDIESFIKNSLDFHPCTHAEIAAILDAVKLGVSVRHATLYSTTFPCHICAKDIITSGITRVVYLEAYPKSKNKELYPTLIDFNTNNKSERVSFEFYTGIGPKRFLYVYSLENKEGENKISLLQFELPKYYTEREDDVFNHLKMKLSNKPFFGKHLPLSDLLDHKTKN